MNEEPANNSSGEHSAGIEGKGTMRQADVKEVRALDLKRAREAVDSVIKEELRSEIVSADVLNFRMKSY